MNNIRFEDYSDKVIKKIESVVESALEEVGGEVEAQVKRNTKVDTGKTKASWTHTVDKKKAVVHIGSPYENALWEEFGTGIYAQNGNGRKDVPWVYRTPDGRYYRTKGKKPRKALQNAFNSMKNKIQAFFERRFKDL